MNSLKQQPKFVYTSLVVTSEVDIDSGHGSLLKAAGQMTNQMTDRCISKKFTNFEWSKIII